MSNRIVDEAYFLLHSVVKLENLNRSNEERIGNMRDTNQALQTQAHGAADFKFKPGARTVKNGVVYYDDTVRWSIWQSTLLVIGVCGSFWAAVIYCALKLFG